MRKSILMVFVLGMLLFSALVSADLESVDLVQDQQVNAFSAYTLDVSGNFRDDGNPPAMTAPLTYAVRLLNGGNPVDCNVHPITCPTITQNGVINWNPQKDSLGADADAAAGVDNMYRIEVTARDSNPVPADVQEDMLNVDVSVNPVLEITNEPARSLKTDLVSNNGLYDYTVAVRFSGDPAANLAYDFRSANPPVLAVRGRDGSLMPNDLSQGRIIWKPTQAEASTRDFIVEVRDVRNNVAVPKRFPLTVEGSRVVLEDGTIGSSQQKRNNPESSVETDHNRSNELTVELVLRNDGDLPLKIGTLAAPVLAPEAGVPAAPAREGFGLLLKDGAENEKQRVEGLTLAPSAVNKVTVKANVVSNFPAVDTALVPRSFQIGTIEVTNEDDANQKDTAVILMHAENRLDIDKVEVCVGTLENQKCEKPKDGDTVDKIKPFDLLSVAVTVENIFKDEDEDPVIENVIVEVDSTDADLDVNDDNEDTDVDVDQKETFSDAIIEVEDDADGTSTVHIRTFGTDENGAKHGLKQTFKVKVERSSHEIDISTARLNPALVSCTPGNRDVQVDADLRNIGKKKERDVKVEARVERSGLNVLKSESGIEMDKDDEHRALLTFNVPELVAPGIYPVEVRSFTDRNQLSDTETVLLTVPDCGFIAPPAPEAAEAEEEPEEEKKQEEVVVAPAAGTASAAPATGTTTTATPIAKKATKTFTAGNAYIGALVAVIAVLLIVGGILVAMIVKKQ